jgi:hypothetical protein
MIIGIIIGIFIGAIIGAGVMCLARISQRPSSLPPADVPLWKVSFPVAGAIQGATALRDTQVGGDHYRSKTIQPWDAMKAWMSEEQFKGFLRGNAIKYLARCDDKGGMEDIKKAGHYIAKMQETQE